MRPWYVWFITLLAAGLLAATGMRLLLIWNGGAPGAVVEAVSRRVRSVQPGSALERAGVRVGDRLAENPALAAGGRLLRGLRVLQWRVGRLQRPVNVLVQRAGRAVTLLALPERPPAAVRLVWALLAMLQVAWSALAMAVLWQHPTDRRAVLLSLVLLGAQSLFVPLTPRPLVLAVTLHFFLAFPAPLPFLADRRRLWMLYLPALAAGPLGLLSGRPRLESLSDATCIGYALLACAAATRRLREPEVEPGEARTLLMAAIAILMATGLAAIEPAWMGSQWLLPLSLVPAAVFGLAIADLLFRRHTLEVRLFLRAGVRTALARRALAALFFVPAMLLAFRLGRLSATQAPVTLEVLLPYAAWAGVVAVLGVTRGRILEGLDRRFFQEAYRAHQAVAGLGKALAGAQGTEEIAATAERAVEEGFGSSECRLLGTEPSSSFSRTNGAVGFPVERAGRSFGTLAVGGRRSGLAYTAEERRLLEGMAGQVAIAMDSARLQEALLDQHRRTMELRSRALVDGAEEERRRLAAELHDHVLPELRHLAAEVERLRGEGSSTNGSAAALGGLEATVREAMDGVREVMEALRPSTLDVLGFTDAVESQLRKCAGRAVPAPRVTFRRSGPEPALTSEQSLALFRIAQEAIQNSVTHSRARAIGVEIAVTDDRLRIRVVDDGVGLAVKSERGGTGRGMESMRYRAELIGASIAWRSGETVGTVVELELPL